MKETATKMIRKISSGTFLGLTTVLFAYNNKKWINCEPVSFYLRKLVIYHKT